MPENDQLAIIASLEHGFLHTFEARCEACERTAHGYGTGRAIAFEPGTWHIEFVCADCSTRFTKSSDGFNELVEVLRDNPCHGLPALALINARKVLYIGHDAILSVVRPDGLWTVCRVFWGDDGDYYRGPQPQGFEARLTTDPPEVLVFVDHEMGRPLAQLYREGDGKYEWVRGGEVEKFEKHPPVATLSKRSDDP